jgi:hypothetical protein
MRTFRILCCTVAMAAFIAPAALANEWDQLTYVTFSQPVQLPNVTLRAGTYAIQLADLWSNRNVVQVFSKDESKIYGTFLTISERRLEATGHPVIMFKEAPAGSPQAVKAFFYPGTLYGKEFVYPVKQAEAISRANEEPVESPNGPVMAYARTTAPQNAR